MKILIVKTSSLGDLIHTFPVIDYLTQRFKSVQIDWVVESAFSELVQAHPLVHRTLKIESKKWRKNFFQHRKEIRTFTRALKEERYDLAVDLQGNIKSSSVLWNVRAHQKVGFGWKTVPEWPNLLFTRRHFNPPKCKNIREDYLSLVQGYFKDDMPFKERPIDLSLTSSEKEKLVSVFEKECAPTLVFPSSAWQNKCLRFESLVKVLKKLDRGPYWFGWGNQDERKMAEDLQTHFENSSVLDRLSLPLLQHVMARSQLVVAMDSLPLHLCGTTSTPSLSFFGPSSALKYRPLGDQHHSIQGECPYGVQFEKRCPQLRTCSTGSCLRGAALDRSIFKGEQLAHSMEKLRPS